MRFQDLVLRCLVFFGHSLGCPLGHPQVVTPAARDLLHLLGDGGFQPTIVDSMTTPLIPIVAGNVAQTTILSSSANGHTHPTLPSSTDLGRTSSITLPSAGGTSTSTSTPTTIAAQVASAPSSSSRPSGSTADTPSSTPSAPYTYVGDASNTPPAELTEWKVIGIAVMTITFIGIIVVSVTFFDSWWRLLREVFCCGPRKFGEPFEGQETMVPDWDKRSWEFRLASEDGHRYPTLASLESIVKEKERLGVKSRLTEEEVREAYSAGLATPELAYKG